MNFEPGDIAACYGHDLTSSMIRWGTAALLAPRDLRIGPSHVALLCEHRNEILWVESTSLCRSPCLIRRERVNGAQAHFPEDRIADYTQSGGRVLLFRLTAINQLSTAESALLTSILIRRFVARGINYDLSGALLSGTRAFQLSRLFPAANLDHLFCSELIAAVLMRLGRMNHANPSRFNPARLLRVLVRTGKYDCRGPLGVEVQ